MAKKKTASKSKGKAMASAAPGVGDISTPQRIYIPTDDAYKETYRAHNADEPCSCSGCVAYRGE